MLALLVSSLESVRSLTGFQLSLAQIIGFGEFPYADRFKRDLKGDDREVAREYWIRLDQPVTDQKLGGDDNLIIFHVHYAGKWHPVSRYRDRSVITQVNVRHTTEIKKKAYHVKCRDLNKLRERHGTSVLEEIPKEGWKWRQQPELSRAMYTVLMRAEECTTLTRSLSIGLSPPGFYDSRKALIWAVTKYDGERVPNLPNAIGDGSRLMSMLQEWGWDVEICTDVTLRDAKESLSEFVDSVKDSDSTSLFAFVGHGVELKGKNYLVPRDAMRIDRDYRGNEIDLEDDLDQMCIPFSFVEKRFAVIRNGSMENTPPTIFLLDCCRNNLVESTGISRCIAGLKTSNPAGPGKSDVVNSILIFSTTAGNTAADGEAGKGGPFMRAFTSWARVPGLVLDDILMETRRVVKENTKQGSSCQIAPHISQLEEKFYFCPPATGGESTPCSPLSTLSQDAVWNVEQDSPKTPMITNLEARAFWEEVFPHQDQVPMRLFVKALKDEFPFLQDVEHDQFQDAIDVVPDGNITQIEFNVFTWKLGFEGAFRKTFEVESPGVDVQV